ncbi:hypothetical protein AK812_SmicGene941 [Symbiodinium microadriaticum]|uniref:Uncharacterized protein n=1 Tax=Symbiodinium microadriaticum TaxID=2951 RepID=A0A1Q9F5C9_SYMMI|nr:hypothetical protein AK812_SmicGene941 [Symbiodinium microadriaticum]
MKAAQELLSGKEFQYGPHGSRDLELEALGLQGVDVAFGMEVFLREVAGRPARTPAKECFVGWDSPCVDRRVDTTLASLYEVADVTGAAGLLDPPLLVDTHARSSVNCAGVAVLYNFISNQCGDDFQHPASLIEGVLGGLQKVGSSSDEDDDNEEFQAGKGYQRSYELDRS